MNRKYFKESMCFLFTLTERTTKNVNLLCITWLEFQMEICVFPQVKSHITAQCEIMFFGSVYVMDRHGNYNNERLLEDSSSSILNPLMCRYHVPSGLPNTDRIIRFYYQVPKGGSKGVRFEDSLYVFILWDNTTGTHGLMKKTVNEIFGKYWSNISLCTLMKCKFQLRSYTKLTPQLLINTTRSVLI